MLQNQLSETQTYLGEHTADRGYESYVNDLGVQLNEGDVVLDVGASAGTFAREVWQQSSGRVFVDSLDTFSMEDVASGKVKFGSSRGDNNEHPFWPYRRLQGNITEGLNIASETYDHVVSSYAVPVWIDSYNDMSVCISEMMRACKTGGDVRMFPMYQTKQGQFSGFGEPLALDHVQRVVEKAGHNFRLELVENLENRGDDQQYRIVIEKKNGNVPSVENFRKFPLLTKLGIVLSQTTRK